MLASLIHAVDGTLDERLAWAMPSLILILLGGLQEPAHGGVTSAYCLLSHSARLAAVRADPTLMPAAVEEGLRWTAPIGNLLRGVAPDTALAGVAIPQHDRVILIVASANRDQAVWGPTPTSYISDEPSAIIWRWQLGRTIASATTSPASNSGSVSS